jgi:hypothetical protein
VETKIATYDLKLLIVIEIICKMNRQAAGKHGILYLKINKAKQGPAAFA